MIITPVIHSCMGGLVIEVMHSCNVSITPQSQRQHPNHIWIHEDGWATDECAERVEIGTTSSKQDCAKQAREAGVPGFAFGEDMALGECYGEVVQVTQEYFNLYKPDPSTVAPAYGRRQDRSLNTWPAT